MTGSHQVSRSLEIANPGPGTEQIILIELDKGWPDRSTEGVLPPIIEKVRPNFSIDGLEAVNPPFKFGGRMDLHRLGVDLDPNATPDEVEMMVLERVALTDLK